MSKFRKIKNAIFTFVVVFFALIAVLPLICIVVVLVLKGFPVLLEKGSSFLTAPLSEGGIGPAIVGSAILTCLSGVIGVPIAVLVGIHVYEYPKSFLGKWARLLLQIMMEFPTILVGVFVMGIIVVPMGRYSAIAGAIALSLILIPYVAVYTTEALREIPFTYKEAAYSIGLTKSKVIFNVMLPMARKGVITGILIGLAKAAGETAPLLFTAGGLYEVFPKSVTKPIGAIPLLIYNLVQSPSSYDHAIAWGASLILMLISLSIFTPLRVLIKEVKL